jgi:hypothetical protein
MRLDSHDHFIVIVYIKIWYPYYPTHKANTFDFTVLPAKYAILEW